VIPLLLALGACEDSETFPRLSKTETPTDKPADNRPVDKPASGTLSVDEGKMSGAVEGGKLLVRIPLAAKGDARGDLAVSLRTVDGKEILDTQGLPYDLKASASEEKTIAFALPPGATAPEEWVRYVVLVEEKGTGLRVTRSTQNLVPSYNAILEGPSSVKKGKPTSYRVRAVDPKTQAPLAGLPVRLRVQKQGEEPTLYEGETGAIGDVIFELTLEEDGAYEVAAEAAAQGTKVAVSSTVSAASLGGKVLLTTDKPIYQPGQTIHLRALALNQGSNTPLAKQSALFEIEDGKGNKIFKRTAATDDHGIVSSDFAIGPVVNMGTFKVRAQVGDLQGEKTVNVSRYALPKFRVGVKTDKEWYLPGQSVQGVLDVGYFFGKPVAGGDVLIEAVALDVGETVLQTFQGKTGADGKLPFAIKLPSSLVGLPINNGNALITLRITATDTAQQQVKQEKAVTVAQSPVDVVLIPEGTGVIPGVENFVDLFATDPLGTPVPNADAAVSIGSAKLTGKTDLFGHLRLAFVPEKSGGLSATAQVSAPGGASAKATFAFDAQQGQEHVLVRSDKAVYDLGETAQIEIRCSDPDSYVYVDWLNGGQVVDMRTIQAKDGVASFSMPLDAALGGSNRIEAYVVDPAGNIIRAGRTIFSRGKGALKVRLDTDKPQYAPGETAKLTFSVEDEEGKPAPAALGVQVVDEAVFALVDARPGLLRTYFELEDQFAQPTYQIRAPSTNLEDLLFNGTKDGDPTKAQAAQAKASAVFSALGAQTPTGLFLPSWPAVQQKAKQILAGYLDAEKKLLIDPLTKAATKAKSEVAASGCTEQQYYCASGKTYGTEITERIAKEVMLVDFWGNAYTFVPTQDYSDMLFRLSSAGPDEQPGTSDDLSISFQGLELGVQTWWGGPTAGGNAGSGGSGGGWDNGGGGEAGGGSVPEGEAGPRVRKDFPETLYVNPALITGPDGKATVSIPMADSITSWRVSSLANSPSGLLGGGLSSVTVFQDFFADINFPATLTRGDEVTFPVAVYNYLEAPQTVKLDLSPGDWYTPLGSTSLSVELQPGEVKGVQVPVRVEKVGTHALTVTALGGAKSDAVSRVVRVIPDGKEIAVNHAGALGAGEIAHTITFPDGAVDGSPHLHLDLYPAFLSQVVSGMDSMLQTPYGCFEQTTSTAWPNVLVTAYMKATGQITPEIQLKAESLMSAGYQRLLTFEHPGGGFSWFGTQDPAPYLSVTAFGLMEFADMAKVHEVDPAMIARTAQWLASKQESDGSWKGDQTEFFSFQTSTIRNTAFVAWALSTAGLQPQSVASALAYAKASYAKEPQDLYTLGIVANAFAHAAPSDPFTAKLLDELEAKKVTDGDKIKWPAGDTQTMFYGGGNDAEITSTALATHAMLVAGGHGPTANGALQYLASARDTQGNFGSTQATIWTLRTLILAASKGTEGAVGAVEVSVNGAPFTTVQLTEEQSDVLHTVDLSSLAAKGSHEVKLSFVGAGKLSYSLVAKHHIPWAAAAPESGPLSLSVSYDKTELAVNDTVLATVAITSNTETSQDMILVTLGIPPGFEVLGEDFDPYLKANTLSKFESTGKQLNLYVSKLAAKETQSYSYRLRATMPVKAEDGGGQVFPYYQPDEKTSASSTLFVVNPG
jgi:hypothetical protein